MTEIIASNLVMLDKRGNGDIKHEPDEHHSIENHSTIIPGHKAASDDLDSELLF